MKINYSKNKDFLTNEKSDKSNSKIEVINAIIA